MSSDSEDPAALASLSSNPVVAMATSLPKPELSKGTPINPFLGPRLHLAHPATWLTQPRVLDSHNADVHGPSEVVGWIWGQTCKLPGSEGLG